MEDNNIHVHSNTGWFDLPFEMREIIIDKMDVETRCRFTKCSKLCEKEAKDSKHYLYGIDVDANDNVIHIYHMKSASSTYQIKFEEVENDQTRIEYKVIKSKRPRVMTSKRTGNPREEMEKYVKEYLEKCKRSIKEFKIYAQPDSQTLIKNINLKNMRKLESFHLYCDEIIMNLSDVSSNVLDTEKLLKLNRLRMPKFDFTFDQIIKFEGTIGEFRSSEFNDDNVAKYLQMWKNEETNQNIQEIRICLDVVEKDFSFDIMKNLDIKIVREMNDWFQIKFFTKSLKPCYVTYVHNYELLVNWDWSAPEKV